MTLLAIALALLVVGGMGVVRKRRKLTDLEERLAQKTGTIKSFQHDTTKAIEVVLRQLLADCDMSNRTHIRITVYRHDSDKSQFIPLARYSDSGRLQKMGRDRYSDSEGLISVVWDKQISVDTNMPEDYEDWVSHLVNAGRFPEETARGLSMQCRSIMGARIEQSGEKVGLVIVESLNALGVSASKLDSLTESVWFTSLASLIAPIKDSILNEFEVGEGGR